MQIAEICVNLNLFIDDNINIEKLVEDIIIKYPDKVKEYKNGKKAIIGMFMGEIMKSCGGKVQPKEVNDILVEKLSK